MDLHNILLPLYEADVKKLRTILKRRRFEFAERAHFTAKKGRLHVTVYEKGPKALVQQAFRTSSDENVFQLQPFWGQSPQRNNPLAPLSDPSNGTPKRPTQKQIPSSRGIGPVCRQMRLDSRRSAANRCFKPSQRAQSTSQNERLPDL